MFNYGFFPNTIWNKIPELNFIEVEKLIINHLSIISSP